MTKNNKISMAGSTDLKFNEGFEMFIKKKKAENLADDSIEFYEESYRYFVAFLEEEKNLTEEISCREVDDDLVIDYIVYMQNKPTIKSTRTINTHLTGLRAIINYLISKKYVEEFKIKLLKVESKEKDIYTDDELELLLKKPDVTKCSFSKYRNWVIVCYFMATGNRQRTVLNIKIKHLDFNYLEIYLEKTKNRKSYTIPMSSFLAEILSEYLEYRKGESDDYLFCTEFGEQLTSGGMKSAIKRYTASRGVTKSSVHLFRHTFATHYMREDNADIYQLKELLEHSSIQQTEHYISELPGVRIRRNACTNPLEKFRGIAGHKKSIKMK